MKEKLKALIDAGDIVGAGMLLSRDTGNLSPKEFNDFNRKIKNSSVCCRTGTGDFPAHSGKSPIHASFTSAHGHMK